MASGLIYAGASFSLLGATFLLTDLPRIAIVVACDVVVAAWFVAASLDVRQPRPIGLARVGVPLAIRAAIEVLILESSVTAGSPGIGGGRPGLGGLLFAFLVLSRTVLLAFWEIALGRWALDRATDRVEG